LCTCISSMRTTGPTHRVLPGLITLITFTYCGTYRRPTPVNEI
jgi:hypothetical protein